MTKLLTCLMLCACLACQNTDTEKKWVKATPIAMEIEIKEDAPLSPYPWYNSNRLKTKDVLVNRIMPPDGFSRTAVEEGSFAYWLRHLPLLKANSKVYYYNDEEKYTQAIHEAVIDIDVSEGDLQRSEDAVIRLRAEYLYSQKRYDEIVFYSKNQDTLALTDVDKTPSYKTFRQYLNKLAAVSTPLSLTESLEFITVQELQIGDVFVQPADPGHAAIVVDMAENKSRRRVFLLAQAFMPAQDIHILKNFDSQQLFTVWYPTNFDMTLYTPEWEFTINDVMRFVE